MTGKTTERVLEYLRANGPTSASDVGYTIWPHRSGMGGHGPDRPTSIALRFLGRMREAGLVLRTGDGRAPGLWSAA